MNSRCTIIIHKALALVRPQFQLQVDKGVHGLPHWSRVWLHGRAIAHEMELNPCVLAWFAFLHNSQRLNDGHDPMHGQRAVEFAFDLRRQGHVGELSMREFECLCEAMRLHSTGITQGDALLQACWDADRLDLGRVGVQPMTHRMSTAAARNASIIDEAMRRSWGFRRTDWPPPCLTPSPFEISAHPQPHR